MAAPLPSQTSPCAIAQGPSHTPPARPPAPQQKYYSRELTHEEDLRRQEILSKVISITPKEPFTAIKFSFQGLYAFLIASFAKYQTELEGTVLIGGAAAYILSKLPYADIDVCFYIGHQSDHLDESQRKVIFDQISFEIKRFIQEHLKAAGIYLNFQQIDQNYFQKKIFINQDSDCFSLFALGDVELKFIYKKPRHNVSTSDGFQVSVAHGVRCINGDAFCEQDGFERAEEALKYRYFHVDNPQHVRSLPFRLIQKFTQGFVVEQPDVTKEALAQLKKNPSQQVKGPCFYRDIRQHQENHYPNSIRGKAVDLLNWCYFLLQLDNSEERHLHYTALASAWLDIEIHKKKILNHFATLLKQDSDLVQHLLHVIHGCFLYEWIKGNKQISAYPILHPHEKPRFFIVIQTEGLTYHLLIPAPQEIIINFCRSLRVLEETQPQLDREALFIDLSLKSIMTDIGFESQTKEAILLVLIESIERGPLAEVLKHQFRDSFSVRSYYQSLMEELNPDEQHLIAFRQISSYLKHLMSEPVAENDRRLLLSAALHALPVENSPEYTEKLKCFQLQLHGKTIVDSVQKRWIAKTILYIVQKIDEHKLYCLYHTLHRLIESAQTLLPPLDYSRSHSLLLKNDALLIHQFPSLFEKFDDSIKGQENRIALITSSLLACERLKRRSKTPDEISLWTESTIEFMNKLISYLPFPGLEQQMHVFFKGCLEEVLALKPAALREFKEIDAIALLSIHLLKNHPGFLEPYLSSLFELANLLLKHSQQSELYLQLVARLGKSHPTEKIQTESHRRLLEFLPKLFLEKEPGQSIKKQTIAILKTLGMSEATLEQLKELDFSKQLCKTLSLCLPFIAERNLRLANEILREFRTNIPLSPADQQDLWVAVLDLIQRNARQHPQFGPAGGVAFQTWMENQFFIRQHRPSMNAAILTTQISTLSAILDAVLSSPKREEGLEKANILSIHLVETIKEGASIKLTPEQRIGISESLSRIVSTLFQKEYPVELIQKLLLLDGTIPMPSDVRLNPCLSPDSTDDTLLRLLRIYATRPQNNLATLQSLLGIVLNFRTTVTSYLGAEKLEPAFKAFDAIKTSNDLPAMQIALNSLQVFASKAFVSQNKEIHSALIDLQLAIISIHLNKLRYEEAYTLFKQLLDAIELNKKKDELSPKYGSDFWSILKSLIQGISNDKKMKEFEQVLLVDCFTALNKNQFIEKASSENRFALLAEICQCKQFIWWKTALQQLKEQQNLNPNQFSSLSETLLKGVLDCRDCPDEAERESFIREFLVVAGSKAPRAYRFVFEHAAHTTNSAYFNLIDGSLFSNEALLLEDQAALYSAVIQYLYILTMQSFKETIQENAYSSTLHGVWIMSIPVLSQKQFQEQSIKAGTCILQLFGEFPFPSFVRIASDILLGKNCKDLKKSSKLIAKGFTKIPIQVLIDTFKNSLCPVFRSLIANHLIDIKPKDLEPFLTIFSALITAPKNTVDEALFSKIQNLFHNWLWEVIDRTRACLAKGEEGVDSESRDKIWAIYEHFFKDNRYQWIGSDTVPLNFFTKDQTFTCYYFHYSRSIPAERSIDTLRGIVQRVIKQIPKYKVHHLHEIRHLAYLLIKQLVAVNTFTADVLALELRHAIIIESIDIHQGQPGEPPQEELREWTNHLHLSILSNLMGRMQQHGIDSLTSEEYVIQLMHAILYYSAHFSKEVAPFYIDTIWHLFERGEFYQSVTLMECAEKAGLFEENKEPQLQLHEFFMRDLNERCTNRHKGQAVTKGVTGVFQGLVAVYKLNLSDENRKTLTNLLRSVTDILVDRLLSKNPSITALHYVTTAMISVCQLNLFVAQEHEQNEDEDGVLTIIHQTERMWDQIRNNLVGWARGVRKKDRDVELFTKWFMNLYPALFIYIPFSCGEILKELSSKFDFSVSGSNCTLGARLREAVEKHQILLEMHSVPAYEAVLEFPILKDETEFYMLANEARLEQLDLILPIISPHELNGPTKTWEDVLAADDTRDGQVVASTIFHYLKAHKEKTFADVETRLRKANRFSYLIATKITSEAEIPSNTSIKGLNGKPARYTLWVSTDDREIALQKKYRIIEDYSRERDPGRLDALNLKNLAYTGIAHEDS